MQLHLLIAFVIVLVNMLSPSDAYAEAEGGRTIKQQEATTGSNIRRTLASAGLPINKQYHELSSDQKSLLRAEYESMSESDEPPYPKNGYVAILGPMSQAQQILGDRGMLSMHVYVDSNGDATRVEIFETPSQEMAKFAAQVVMKTKFKPAVCGSTPCAMAFPVRMELRREL